MLANFAPRSRFLGDAWQFGGQVLLGVATAFFTLQGSKTSTSATSGTQDTAAVVLKRLTGVKIPVQLREMPVAKAAEG